jgi:hypothetical protein
MNNMQPSNDGQIQSIATEYNGITYRSRTEARWAVFMTMVGCPFEYEPEGFDLGGGVCYIPDFWLPTCKAFFEIKPCTVLPGRESPCDLFVEKTGIDLYLSNGYPNLPLGFAHFQISYHMRMMDADTLEYSTGYDEGYCFCECPVCRRVEIQFNGRADRIACNCKKSAHGDKGYNGESQRFIDAYRATYMAFRFQRGGGK